MIDTKDVALFSSYLSGESILNPKQAKLVANSRNNLNFVKSRKVRMQDHQDTRIARLVHREQAHHVRVTTMDDLGQGSLHPLVKHPETDMSRPAIESRPPASGWQSSKELPSQILICLFGTSTILMYILYYHSCIINFVTYQDRQHRCTLPE